MQLLEDDGAKVYSVWFRWGRGELMRHLLEAEMFALTQEVNTRLQLEDFLHNVTKRNIF